MNFRLAALGAVLLVAAQIAGAQRVEEVRTRSPDTPGLPEDLFALPPGAWVFASHLWKGNDPCTADQCEADYTDGPLVVSVERAKTYLRIIAGFRDCGSIAWNEYEIGNKASARDTKLIGKRLNKTIDTSAKYCKVPAPTVAALDASLLYPAQPQPQH